MTSDSRRRESIDDLYSAEFGKGSVQVTGSIEAYFESNEVYQRALDHESAAITAMRESQVTGDLVIPSSSWRSSASGP